MGNGIHATTTKIHIAGFFWRKELYHTSDTNHHFNLSSPSHMTRPFHPLPNWRNPQNQATKAKLFSRFLIRKPHKLFCSEPHYKSTPQKHKSKTYSLRTTPHQTCPSTLSIKTRQRLFLCWFHISTKHPNVGGRLPSIYVGKHELEANFNYWCGRLLTLDIWVYVLKVFHINTTESIAGNYLKAPYRKKGDW